jgi:hypothetical protein
VRVIVAPECAEALRDLTVSGVSLRFAERQATDEASLHGAVERTVHYLEAAMREEEPRAA